MQRIQTFFIYICLSIFKYHSYEESTTIVSLFNAFGGCFCC